MSGGCPAGRQQQPKLGGVDIEFDSGAIGIMAERPARAATGVPARLVRRFRQGLLEHSSGAERAVRKAPVPPAALPGFPDDAPRPNA